MRPSHGSICRLLALFVAGLLPWTVIVGPGGVEFVFLYGLAVPATGHFVSLPTYLFVLTSGLPDRLLAWPASALLYLAALVSASVSAITDDRLPRGDARLTPGLVGLAALAHLAFDLGVVTREGSTVVPVGPVLAGLVLWWFYWPALRGAVAAIDDPSDGER